MRGKIPGYVNNELVKMRDDIRKCASDCVRKAGNVDKGFRMFKRKYNNILRDNGNNLGCYIEHKKNNITVRFYASCKDKSIEISNRIDLEFITRDYTLANTYKNLSGTFRVTELDVRNYLVQCMSFDWSQLSIDKKAIKKESTL